MEVDRNSNEIMEITNNNEIDGENMELFKEVIILEVEEQPKSGYHLTSINTTQYENSVKIKVVVVRNNDCKNGHCLSKNFSHNINSIDTSLENNKDDTNLDNNESFSKSILKSFDHDT